MQFVACFMCLQYKTSEVRAKCTGLMRVNLYKDQISTSGSMPPLPNDKALYASLRPAYNVLKAAGQERAHARPMYAITDDQRKAANSFLKVSDCAVTARHAAFVICSSCMYQCNVVKLVLHVLLLLADVLHADYIWCIMR